ncbi:MAG: hypothetical protein NT062_03400, partial [Proteobacteria bacterium]|nr:hypothetical protein [Pseudomonadota bacterium]
MDDLASFGIYGGAALSSFVFGIVPFNPDIVLFGISAKLVDSIAQLPLLVVVATVAHVFAKVITYYMGIGLLAYPQRKPKWKRLIDRAQTKLDKWNRWPHFTVGLAAVVGLPPLFVIGFIAHALRVRIFPFIAIVTL